MLGKLMSHARNGTLGARLRPGGGPWQRLSNAPSDKPATASARRINCLYSGMESCSSYLEVGVQHGQTLQDVRVPFRWGVDPAPLFRTDRLPPGVRFSSVVSDRFFAELAPQHRFDLAFLDGLHECGQTYRDLINTLNHASGRCIIIIDDVMPSDRYSALPDLALAMREKQAAGLLDGRWHGDVYKVLIAIRDTHPELDFVVIGTNAVDDNAQAILWRRDGQDRKYDLDNELGRIQGYAEFNYDDVFVNGSVPDNFSWQGESDGLSRALRGG